MLLWKRDSISLKILVQFLIWSAIAEIFILIQIPLSFDSKRDIILKGNKISGVLAEADHA